MKKDSRIYVAGHKGLLGSALMRALQARGYKNPITRNKKELDLTNEKKVADFFAHTKPEYVFCAAGRVGGMADNMAHPAEFIYENLAMQNNLIHHAYRSGVKKLIFFGSNCMYPRITRQPIKEEYLFQGPFEPTNDMYAVAKAAGTKMCEAYNREHGTDFITVVPASFFGPNDQFSNTTGRAHMIPGLIEKFHDAKVKKLPEVLLRDNPKKIREFIYVEDVAEGCLFLMNMDTKQFQSQGGLLVNMGTGVSTSVKQLAETIQKVTGFKGKIIWDKNAPLGMPKKVMSASRIHRLGWHTKNSLFTGLQKTYRWYLANAAK